MAEAPPPSAPYHQRGGGISKNTLFTENLWTTASDFSFSRFLSQCKMLQKRIDDLKMIVRKIQPPITKEQKASPDMTV